MKLVAKKDIYDAVDASKIIFYKGKIYETRLTDSGNIVLKTELGNEEYFAIFNDNGERESLYNPEEFNILTFD